MTKKFIRKITEAMTPGRLEEIKKEILEPKMETTQYYQDLAKAPNITAINFFRFLRYHG